MQVADAKGSEPSVSWGPPSGMLVQQRGGARLQPHVLPLRPSGKTRQKELWRVHDFSAYPVELVRRSWRVHCWSKLGHAATGKHDKTGDAIMEGLYSE